MFHWQRKTAAQGEYGYRRFNFGDFNDSRAKAAPQPNPASPR